MNFKWTIKNKLSGTLIIRDLGKKGCYLRGGEERPLHLYYTLEELQNSEGLKEAYRLQHITEIEKYLPPVPGQENQEIAALREQLSTLTSAMQTLITQGIPQVAATPPPTADSGSELLSKILEKIESLPAAQQSGPKIPKGFKELSSAEVALKIMDKMPTIKESNFSDIGVKENITTNASEIADQLKDIDIDIDEENV